MAFLTSVLHLVVYLMILVPFILFTSASVLTMYFKCKEEYNKKMVGLFGKALKEIGSAMVKKENDDA